MTELLKRFSFADFRKFIRELLIHIEKDDVPQVAAMLAYYLMVGIFPFLIFFLNLLSFTPLGQLEVILDMMEFIPEEAAVILGPILIDLVKSRSGTLLSFSLFLALWSGSLAMMNLIRSMNRAFNLIDNRSYIVKRVLSVLYTFILAIMILAVLVGPIFGDAILAAIFTFIGYQPWIAAIWGWIKSVFPLLTLILGFAVIYKYGPSFPKGTGIKFRVAMIGAVVATAGWLAVSSIFSYYVNNFGYYANTYGSLGGVIVLLFWLYLSAMMFVLGAEVSATYVFLKKPETESLQADTIHHFVREKRNRASFPK